MYPRFDARERCPKCGGLEPFLRFDRLPVENGVEEVLEVECSGCGYLRLRAPLDAARDGGDNKLQEVFCTSDELRRDRLCTSDEPIICTGGATPI